MPSTLSKRAWAALIDIRFNIVLVGDFLHGFDAASFQADLKTLYATTRALEIISEASRRLPQDLKQRHPQIPWQDVKSAGNVYRHNDEDVVATLIWQTATEKLPPLLSVVEDELARADFESS